MSGRLVDQIDGLEGQVYQYINHLQLNGLYIVSVNGRKSKHHARVTFY